MKEYNLVDIHFHTEDSYDTIPEKYDWPKINGYLKDKIDLLIKTDHNYLGYKKYTEIKKILDFKILPGIELNIKSTGKHVHWIFIFNDKQLDKVGDNGKIKGEFFEEELNTLLYNTNSTITNTMKKEFTGIESKEIIDLIISHGLDVMVVPHLNKSAGYFDKKRNKEDVLELIDLINQGVILSFESKEYSQVYAEMIKNTSRHIEELVNKGEDVGGREEYLITLKEFEAQRRSSEYSIVYGSDFHLTQANVANSGHSDTIERYTDQIDNLFYMKALPTFRGLQLSLSDQKSRVIKKSDFEKYQKVESNVIKEIRFTNNGVTETIEFGSGINSLIGLRGSGKSYILNSIRNQRDIYKNSKIYDEINNFKIEFANREEVEIDINFKGSDYFDYIGQKNGNYNTDLNLYNILMDAPHDNSEFIKVLEEYAEKVDSVQEQNVSIIYNDLFSKYNDMYQTINKANTDLYNKKLIEIINDKKESDEEKFLNLVIEAQRKYEKNIDLITLRIEKLNNIIEVLKDHKIIEDYEKKWLSHDEMKFIEEMDSKTLIKIYRKLISENSSLLTNLKTRKKYVDNLYNSINKKMTIKQQTVNNQVDNFKKSIRKLYQLNKTTNQIINVPVKTEYRQASYKIDTKTTITYVIRMQYENLDEILKNFKSGKTKLLENKQLSFDNIKNFTYENAIDLVQLKNSTRKTYFTNFPSQDIIKIVDGEIEKSLQDLSPGQRTSYVLKLALSQNSNKPLLIDQPEDDLDNNTIYSYLVSELRHVKVKRQVILVSHNANIVLNSDSDRVVYCRRVSDNFTYKSVRLEDEENIQFTSFSGTNKEKNILEVCCNILEGGEKALSRRIKKIGYKAVFLNGGSNGNKE